MARSCRMRVRIHEPALGPDLWSRVSEPHVSHWLGHQEGAPRDYCVATRTTVERRRPDHALVERWLLELRGNPVAMAVAPDASVAVVLWQGPSGAWGLELVTLVGQGTGQRWGRGRRPESGSGRATLPTRPVFLPGGRRFVIAAGCVGWQTPTRARRVPGREPSGELFMYDLSTDELRSVELFAVPPPASDEKEGFDWRRDDVRIAPPTIANDDEISLTLQTGEVLSVRVSEAWYGVLSHGPGKVLVRLVGAKGASVVRCFDVPGGLGDATTRRFDVHRNRDFVAMTLEQPGRPRPLQGVWSLESGANLYSLDDGTLVSWIHDTTAKNRASAKPGELVLMKLGPNVLEVFERSGQSLLARKRGSFAGSPRALLSNEEGTVIAIGWSDPDTHRGGVIVRKLHSPADVMTDGGHELPGPTSGIVAWLARDWMFAFAFVSPQATVREAPENPPSIVGHLFVVCVEGACARPIHATTVPDGAPLWDLHDHGEYLELRLSESERCRWSWDELRDALTT